MGKEVASLFATLGLDSSGLKKGLTDAKVGLSSFKTQMNDVSKALTGFDASTLASTAGIGMIVSEYKKAITETMEYAKQVRTLSRNIGASAEDASKLIQVADDTEISFETLNTALIYGAKNGIDVTYTGLGKLADQYLAIQDPLDRTTFLTDTFGKSGANMGGLFSLGSMGIKSAADQAERYGQILTDEDIQATEDFRIAMDGLNDSTGKLKEALALDLIPTLTTVLNTVTPVFTLYNDFKTLIDEIPEPLSILTRQFESMMNPIKLLAGPIYYVVDGLKQIISLAKNSDLSKFSGNSIYTTPNAGMTHASGGSIMLPASAGYEGVNLGGGHTASGNEMLTVSNQKQIGDIMNSLENTASLLRRLPGEIRIAVRDGNLQDAAR